MNIFEKENLNSEMIHSQRAVLILNRIYAAAFTLTMVIVALGYGLSTGGTSVTVASPSLQLYEQMQDTHPSSLSCPCENAYIPYDAFMSLTPVYHQVMANVDKSIYLFSFSIGLFE